LRVLTFTSLYPNSVEPLQGIFIHERISHFARHAGNEVQVVAPVPYFPSWLHKTRWQKFGQVPRSEEIGGLCIHHPRYFMLPGVSMPFHGMLLYLACLRTARRANAEKKFDCIDAHFVYPDGFAAILLGRALGLPVFVSARGSDINLYSTFRFIRPMLRWTLKSAAGVIAVSAALKQRIAELNVPEEKVQIISNGVDTNRFQPLDRNASRLRLGLSEQGPIIISVGSLIESKGHHLLIASVEKLAHQYPSLRLYIVGEGVYRSELEKLVNELKLQDRVHLMGTRRNDELSAWFSAADLSCLLSSREGWPNVVSESLACGTPVVATKAGGIPEIIVSPDMGILVERNIPSITAGLEQALNSSWNREKIARVARTRSWDAVAVEVETFFRSRIKDQESTAKVTAP
jgi:teichuronic acid biosynthesis glycosyltransferase TuaC